MKREKMVIIILLITGFVSILILEYPTPNEKVTITNVETTVITKTTTFTSEQPPSIPLRVLDYNITLQGPTACMAIYFDYLYGCPASGNDTLSHVELISYDGSPYYLVTLSNVVINGAPMTFTLWFTNSTVICTNPLYQTPDKGYRACP
jgi:hypothetical protein